MRKCIHIAFYSVQDVIQEIIWQLNVTRYRPPCLLWISRGNESKGLEISIRGTLYNPVNSAVSTGIY